MNSSIRERVSQFSDLLVVDLEGRLLCLCFFILLIDDKPQEDFAITVNYLRCFLQEENVILNGLPCLRWKHLVWLHSIFELIIRNKFSRNPLFSRKKN